MSLARFANWLLEETGIDAESLGAQALARAVAARAAATAAEDTPHADAAHDAYWTVLTTTAAERQALIDTLVVPETWFFREREAFAALARGGMERLVTHPGEVLRVLSAPCSTGEEPYSAAMALMDAGFTHEQFGIDAIDISSASIEAAARGVYGRNAFRGDALQFRERYFHAPPQGWQLADAVRRAVHFERANLFEWLAAHPVRYDFIFCRNVLIYFDRQAQDRAIGLLRARLADGGMIFVGPAETGLMMRHEFASAQIPLAFGFRWTGGEGALAAQAADRLAWSANGVRPGHDAAAFAATTNLPSHASPHASLRPLHGVPAARAAALPVTTAAKTTVKTAVPRAPMPFAMPASTAPKATPNIPTLAEARRLADAGSLDAAAHAAAQHAQAAPDDAEAWYLLGLIADAQGEAALALGHYRKTLYLEPGHYEALTHLAALLEVQGDADAARRLMRRAERASPRGPGDANA
ncbi:CheR family methyltransferase [Burkholderia sp. Ax-1719]|uniref:CheR family methyltransferase n=1 Tax=Burkholderia sp. Ax-1719 TaxID=2608334 RepID=UPI00141ED101|nr:CheR family methyltransferase [Burkholderia sp. Ax-1719]NIE65301.1 methyltransferase [Burkholderia sp. Ax-1719]